MLEVFTITKCLSPLRLARKNEFIYFFYLVNSEIYNSAIAVKNIQNKNEKNYDEKYHPHPISLKLFYSTNIYFSQINRVRDVIYANNQLIQPSNFKSLKVAPTNLDGK